MKLLESIAWAFLLVGVGFVGGAFWMKPSMKPADVTVGERIDIGTGFQADRPASLPVAQSEGPDWDEVEKELARRTKHFALTGCIAGGGLLWVAHCHDDRIAKLEKLSEALRKQLDEHLADVVAHGTPVPGTPCVKGSPPVRRTVDPADPSAFVCDHQLHDPPEWMVVHYGESSPRPMP